LKTLKEVCAMTLNYLTNSFCQHIQEVNDSWDFRFPSKQQSTEEKPSLGIFFLPLD